MFTSFHVEGWRCLVDTTVHLSPLHALIGPNDSGKSTLLDALRQSITNALPAEFELRHRDGDLAKVSAGRNRWALNGSLARNGVQFDLPMFRARTFRLDGDALRQPSSLLFGDVVTFGERGQGLAGVYDAILSRDRDAWDAIEASVREGFPTVRRLALKAVSASEKVLETELLDGTRVRAEQMSEGLLYWLAFSALPYVDPCSLLLLEEPENGLHPARIAEVMGVLRRLTENGTQVLLATHSPLVVNELQPHEVSVITRTPERGTKARAVSEVPTIDRLMTGFALGELWMAFADGEDHLFDAPAAESA